jgi:hypothetical protein
MPTGKPNARIAIAADAARFRQLFFVRMRP